MHKSYQIYAIIAHIWAPINHAKTMETVQMQMPWKFHASHVNYANTKQEKNLKKT